MSRGGRAWPVGAIGLGAALLGALVLRGERPSGWPGDSDRDPGDGPLQRGQMLQLPPLPQPAVSGDAPARRDWPGTRTDLPTAESVTKSLRVRERLRSSTSELALAADIGPALPAAGAAPEASGSLPVPTFADAFAPEPGGEPQQADAAPIMPPVAPDLPDLLPPFAATAVAEQIAEEDDGAAPYAMVANDAVQAEAPTRVPVLSIAEEPAVAADTERAPIAPPDDAASATTPEPVPAVRADALAAEPGPPVQESLPEPEAAAADMRPVAFPLPELGTAAEPASTADAAPGAVPRMTAARRTIAARGPAAAAAPVASTAAPVPANDVAVSFPEPVFGNPQVSAQAAALTGLPRTQPVPSANGVAAGQPTARLAPAAGHETFPSAGPPGFSYDDELILQIRVADFPGDDTLIAYGTRSGVYLPFGMLARFLDLGVAVSDDGHYASGWFLDESRTLVIDLRQRLLTVAGQTRPLAPDDAVAFDGELYLKADRYGEILPIDIATNLRDQSVTIRTREPFPFEQRLRRDADRARLNARAARAEPQQWPREETPWRALDVPMADVEMRAVSDSTFGSRGEADLRIAGDLAFMTAQAWLSATTRDGLVSSNISVGRADADGDLFGPLRATEFGLGDVSTPTMALGLRGTGGRGAFIGNVPIESRSVFDRIDLRGVLPDGYEVELYRNDILIESTREPVNGEYRFEQVSLDYGLNVLRLVFYGPQGQRSEEVRRISVGDGRPARGQLVYSAGLAQKDVNLLGVRGPQFYRREDYGAWRAVGQLSYGISSAVTASLGGAWFESDRGTRWLGTAGLRTGIAGIATRLDLGMANGGAKAASLGLGGRVLGASVTLNHGEYRGEFVDEARSLSGDYLTRVTELEANANLGFGSGLSGFTIPVAARARRIEFRDGRQQTSAALRASGRFSGLLASNTLEFLKTNGGGVNGRAQLYGSFDLASLSRTKFQLRGAVGYSVLPAARITSASVELDRAIGDRTIVHGAVSHSFKGRDTQFGLSAVRKFDRFTLAVEGSYGVRQKSHSANLRLGMTLGRDPLAGRLFAAPPGQAGSGAIALRAFRDTDGDRRFGPADEALEGVEFFAGNRTGTSGADGVALLTGLGSARVSVQADPASLPDIDLAPVSRGIEIVARPGRVHASDYAVVELSEIEGTAFFAGEGNQRGVSGLRLQLVDAAGKTVRQVRTEADGFYLFEQIMPGRYTLALDPVQAGRLRIRMVEPVAIAIGPRAQVVSRKIVVASD